jgi:hypothetical protein
MGMIEVHRQTPDATRPAVDHDHASAVHRLDDGHVREAVAIPGPAIAPGPSKVGEIPRLRPRDRRHAAVERLGHAAGRREHRLQRREPGPGLHPVPWRSPVPEEPSAARGAAVRGPIQPRPAALALLQVRWPAKRRVGSRRPRQRRGRRPSRRRGTGGANVSRASGKLDTRRAGGKGGGEVRLTAPGRQEVLKGAIRADRHTPERSPYAAARGCASSTSSSPRATSITFARWPPQRPRACRRPTRSRRSWGAMGFSR